MLLYKSHCRQTKTFYGVEFKYGDRKAVPGYIHDNRFVCLGSVDSANIEVDDSASNATVETKEVKSSTSVKSTTKPQDKKSEVKKPDVKKTQSTAKPDKSDDKKAEETKTEEKKS